MCLFTHFAAGALAGGLTGNLAMGAVAGLASHAVLDAIPHYDHPDWRLELGGGVLSLALLVLMPFATIPAILGGICGMLPDLENLFQKLGKMRRDQFIFPSHTGLIPHGRTLGPRTLVWQVAIFVACFGLLGLISPGEATAAPGDRTVMGKPQISVLEAGQDRTVIQVRFPVTSPPSNWQELEPHQVQWALPFYLDEDSGPETVILPPRLDLPLSVPTTGRLTVKLSGLSWWKEPVRPVSDADLVQFGSPAIFRSVPLTAGRLVLGAEDGILRSAVLEITHPATSKRARQLRLARDFTASGQVDRWSEPTPAGILNPQLFQTLARGGRQLAVERQAALKSADKGQYNHFDLTDNWVRLEVTESGLYRLTGQQLSNMGVPAAGVDPTKLRLFQGGGLHLAQDPEIPEADQVERVGLNEMSIQVLDGGDGEWNLDDEIRFYGFGASVWLDRLDASAAPLDHYDHPYCNTGVYWLNWESYSVASPLPGNPLRVAEVNAPANGGQRVNAARRRVHSEQPNVDASGIVSDNWSWDSTVYSTRQGSFEVHRPLPDSLAHFVMDIRGNPPYQSDNDYIFSAIGRINNDTALPDTTKFTRGDMADSLRVRVFGRSLALVQGSNDFTLENVGITPRQPLALDSFDVLYWSELNLRGLDAPFEFAHWGYQVGTPGETFDIELAVQDAVQTVVWDVTDPLAARVLAGTLNGGPPATVILGVSRDPATDLHLVALDGDDFLTVPTGYLAEPIALRDQSSDLDYLVIYAAPFAQAAANLADYHDQELVGVSNPAARAVLVDDIYDNFSGGRKDLLAIRNYLKQVFEDGHRLRYVCLLGNASRDYRNYKGHEPFVDLVDFVPAQLRTTYPVNPSTNLRNSPYSSDDGLTSFDPPPSATDVDFPDLASGRLPATTVDQANAMVEVMISSGSNPESGLWRNRFLMTSDDCNRPGVHYPRPLANENSHTLQAENLTNNYLPGTLDIQKIYGVEYEFPPGSLVKPLCRSDINAALNAGTTVFHYVGHGSEDNLADEQIFQSRDIANLNNGLRRPLFVAFSCDVGVYDSPIRRSMAELFLASEAGGAVASICASQVSYVGDNNSLSNAFYSNLFPDDQVQDDITVSTALMLSKAQMGNIWTRKNSQRYNLFSDPGLRLPNPVSDLGFAAASLDTLRAGARQVVVAASDGHEVTVGPGDAYDLRVEESAYPKTYVVYSFRLDYSYDPPRYIYTPSERSFIKLGAPVFRGSGIMTGEELRIPFKVPSQLRYGDSASVRLIIDGLQGEHTAEMALPAVRSSTGPVDDVHGPAIALTLPNRYRVRPGDPLNAALDDTSGIAILGTSPGNSILLEFDDTGFMTEVTESFYYEPNSYTTGRLVFPLPGDIASGPHKVALHASDALGNVGSDTLSFTVAEYGVTAIKDVTLFPNPTPGPCRLVFDLTDGMDVQWEIYTLSGRRLKTLGETFTSAGPGILFWDGRDDQGDEIANGTYLFVLRGHWDGNDGRDLKETGKLVIMR